jgi:hypothetical protein
MLWLQHNYNKGYMSNREGPLVIALFMSVTNFRYLAAFLGTIQSREAKKN